ncbi:unnamed protein product [Sphagnum jensenii]|uniref:VQ domain-containing protein n=1 Tax=Sphagnum jensenii TaxID=128206 RepID=A0ABP0XBJ8_9BRYO
MSPYMSENGGFTEEYVKSGDPMLGLCKTSHTLGKPATSSRSPGGVRRKGSTHHHPEATLTMNAPTIRVIHIFAPKIIKTDIANFRSTVQRLTGRTRSKPDNIGPQVRRARTKTVVAATACGAAVGSPDSSSGFQADTDHHHQLLSRQSSMSAHAAGDSTTFPTVREGVSACCTDQQDSPDLRCSNNMETDNYSLTSNSMDSSTFSFYSSIDSNTCNQDLLQNQGAMHSPGSDGSSFFSHRQAPYSLNEIPAPFFSGDFLQSTAELMPSCCNVTQDFASTLQQTTAASSSAAALAAEITSRDLFLPLPPLDYSGLASFSDLDILAGLGSTLPDLPLNLPPLVSSSSNGLFYDSILMQPPLCR